MDFQSSFPAIIVSDVSNNINTPTIEVFDKSLGTLGVMANDNLGLFSYVSLLHKAIDITKEVLYLNVMHILFFKYHFLECLGDRCPALINDFGEVSFENFFDVIDPIIVECVNVPIGISDIIRIS